MISQIKKNVSPKKYLTFDCTHDRMIFAPGKHLFLLDLTKHTIETFLLFFYVKEINSPEKEKKKRLNGQYLFFLPGNHFTRFHKWEKKEQSPDFQSETQERNREQ